jgi:splicing factor 3B subunit 2
VVNLQSESEEEVESEEELDEVGAEAEASGVASGFATPLRDGIASITSGLDTPESIDLRKNSRSGAGLETPITPATPITPMTPMTPMTPVDQPELYHVLQPQASSIGTNVLMGSSHTYVMPPAGGKAPDGEGEGVPESEDGDAEQEKKRKRAEKAASGAPVKKKSKDYKNVF